MNVAYYLDNQNTKSIDFFEFIKGNPGTGGTQYLTIYIAFLLQKKSRNRIKLFLSNEQKGLYDVEYQVKSLEDAISEKSVDYLVINNGAQLELFEKLISDNKKKIIVWARNNFECKQLKYLNHAKCVAGIVFVSKQQYDYYKNEILIDKATYIFHTLPFSDYELSTNKEKIITFMGSLTKSKGFHLLADQWKKVIKKHPDAKLIVIGKGNLYNRDMPLGKFNLSNTKYEKRFLRKITENGKLIQSVIFLGNLSYSERKEVFNKTKIGIANPTGKSETFCLSALEFIRHGIPVVSIFDYSLPDVVSHNKTGYLIRFKRNLHKIINTLLDDNNKLDVLTEKASLDNSFKHSEITKMWDDFFEDLRNNKINNLNISKPIFKFKKMYVLFGLLIYKMFRIRIINYFCLNQKLSKLKYKISAKFTNQ